MKKERNKPITNHGLLHDTVNYDALIKAQANTVTQEPVRDTNNKKVEGPKVKTKRYHRS